MLVEKLNVDPGLHDILLLAFAPCRGFRTLVVQREGCHRTHRCPEASAALLWKAIAPMYSSHLGQAFSSLTVGSRLHWR